MNLKMPSIEFHVKQSQKPYKMSADKYNVFCHLVLYSEPTLTSARL